MAPSTLGTIAAGGSTSFTVTATVPSPTAPPLVATVKLSGTLADDNYAASTAFALIPTATPPDCSTPTLSPAGPISVPASGGAFTIQVTGVPVTCQFNVIFTNIDGPMYASSEQISPGAFTLTYPPSDSIWIGRVELYVYIPIANVRSAPLLLRQAEQPYSEHAGATRPLTSLGTFPPIPGVTIHFQLVSGTGPVPADVTTDSSGQWKASGFTTGTSFAERYYGHGNVYRVMPSKAGYTFPNAYFEFGPVNFAIPDFTGIPIP